MRGVLGLSASSSLPHAASYHVVALHITTCWALQVNKLVAKFALQVTAANSQSARMRGFLGWTLMSCFLGHMHYTGHSSASMQP